MYSKPMMYTEIIEMYYIYFFNVVGRTFYTFTNCIAIIMNCIWDYCSSIIFCLLLYIFVSFYSMSYTRWSNGLDILSNFFNREWLSYFLLSATFLLFISLIMIGFSLWTVSSFMLDRKVRIYWTAIFDIIRS